MSKQNKGITLIALIITIIVMMILVAVSVTVALDGGLFGTAKDAASKTQIEAEKEMLLPAVVGAIGTDAKVDFSKIQLPDGFTGKNGTYTSLKGNTFIVSENGEIAVLEQTVTVVPYEELTENLKTAMDEEKITAVLKETKDGIEMQAVIPAGFKVSTKSGENTISGGLVVSDANGNEFVWVPCTTDVTDTSGLTKYAQDTKYNDGTIASKQLNYTNYSDWKDEGGNSDSVSKYGGFYVGRYEAGIPSNAPFYASKDGDTYVRDGKNVATYIPVSKPNNPSWNYISQANAKIVSENMYSSNISVESSLIDSYAWDTIVNWMEKEIPSIAIDSTDYGNYINSSLFLTDGLYDTHIWNYEEWNYKSIATKYKRGRIEIPERSANGEQTLYEISTGSTDETKILNIYDMAGNVWEFTTEVSNSTQMIARRGGSFIFKGNDCTVAYRRGNVLITGIFPDCGFRVVLYVK